MSVPQQHINTNDKKTTTATEGVFFWNYPHGSVTIIVAPSFPEPSATEQTDQNEPQEKYFQLTVTMDIPDDRYVLEVTDETGQRLSYRGPKVLAWGFTEMTFSLPIAGESAQVKLTGPENFEKYGTYFRYKVSFVPEDKKAIE